MLKMNELRSLALTAYLDDLCDKLPSLELANYCYLAIGGLVGL